MQKILSLIVVLVIIIGAAPAVFADGPVITVGEVSGKTGDIVEVPVTLSGNTGFSSLEIEISYDFTALELVSVTKANEVTGIYTTSQTIDTVPYYLGIVKFDENSTYNGQVYTLNFKINATAGEYPVNVSYYKGVNGNNQDGKNVNFDFNFNSINLSYVSGRVSVNNGVVEPEISINNSYTIFNKGEINNSEVPVIYIYGEFNNFTAESDDEYGFSLWNASDAVHKVRLKAYSDDKTLDKPQSGKNFVIKVYGDAIKSTESYSFAPFIGNSEGDNPHTISYQGKEQ